MSQFEIIKDSAIRVFKSLFTPESDLISEEFQEIISNPDDKRAYFKAVEDARRENSEKRITLPSGKKLLVSP